MQRLFHEDVIVCTSVVMCLLFCGESSHFFVFFFHPAFPPAYFPSSPHPSSRKFSTAAAIKHLTSDFYYFLTATKSFPLSAWICEETLSLQEQYESRPGHDYTAGCYVDLHHIISWCRRTHYWNTNPLGYNLSWLSFCVTASFSVSSQLGCIQWSVCLDLETLQKWHIYGNTLHKLIPNDRHQHISHF